MPQGRRDRQESPGLRSEFQLREENEEEAGERLPRSVRMERFQGGDTLTGMGLAVIDWASDEDVDIATG